MVNVASEPSASLPEYLAARARASSDSRLVADAIGGLAGIVAFGFWRVPGWYALVAAGTCFFAYGVWAIVNRELLAPHSRSRISRVALRAASLTAASAGVGAGIFLIMIVLAKALGRIIS